MYQQTNILLFRLLMDEKKNWNKDSSTFIKSELNERPAIFDVHYILSHSKE